MEIRAETEGLKSVQHLLARLSGVQQRQASALALNDAGHRVRLAMRQQLEQVFIKPTPYVLRSIWLTPALPERLVAKVLPTYFGGKGIDPQKILKTQESGGQRADKRIELALRRVGILPSGYQTALPASPMPGSHDGRGNLTGAFATRLISYFRAFGEQGYKANMTDRRRENLHASGTRFFVSYGRLRGGKTGHLAPGIWLASGATGASLQAVLFFVPRPTYQARIHLDAIGRRALEDGYLARRWRYRIRQMAGV